MIVIIKLTIINIIFSNKTVNLSLLLTIPYIDWEDSGYIVDPHTVVNVPQFDSPLIPEQVEQLREHINLLQPSETNGMDIFLSTVQYVQNLSAEN